MGSTYVDFEGRGFEAPDGVIEVWLSLLVDEIDLLPDVPEWLNEAREEWKIQATECFNFGVMPGLDLIVIDTDKRDEIIVLCERILKRLDSYGPSLSPEELNAMAYGSPKNGVFMSELPTAMFIVFGQSVIRLLREQDVSDEEAYKTTFYYYDRVNKS